MIRGRDVHASLLQMSLKCRLRVFQFSFARRPIQDLDILTVQAFFEHLLERARTERKVETSSKKVGGQSRHHPLIRFQKH